MQMLIVFLKNVNRLVTRQGQSRWTCSLSIYRVDRYSCHPPQKKTELHQFAKKNYLTHYT